MGVSIKNFFKTQDTDYKSIMLLSTSFRDSFIEKASVIIY